MHAKLLSALSLLTIIVKSAATRYIGKAGYSCGYPGYSRTINRGDTVVCCSQAPVQGYDFTLTTSKTFAYSSNVHMGSSSSSTQLEGSDCVVSSSSQTCSGDACCANDNCANDVCKADRCCFPAGNYCMHVSCDDPNIDCEFDEWTLSFDSASNFEFRHIDTMHEAQRAAFSPKTGAFFILWTRLKACGFLMSATRWCSTPWKHRNPWCPAIRRTERRRLHVICSGWISGNFHL